VGDANTMKSYKQHSKKVFLVLILLIIFVSKTSYSSDEKIKAVILAEDAFPPFSSLNGGFSNEVVVAAFKASGVKVSLEVYPFSRLMMMVKSGTAAGGFNAIPTTDNENQFLFGKYPIYVSQQRFYYSVDDPVVINTEEDIFEKLVKQDIVVGDVRGYIYPPAFELLKSQTAKNGRNLIYTDTVKSDEKLIKKLLLGRNRVALMHSEVASLHIKNMNIEDKIRFGNFAWEAPLYIAFSKVNPNASFLIEAFDKGMEVIIDNGVYDYLLKKYSLDTPSIYIR